MIKALTRDEVIATGWSGDATLTDLLTGITFTIRGSRPVNYNHSDFQTRTKEDTALMRKATGATPNWTPRPALWRFGNHVSAVSYHSFNHSIVVASPADNIVGPPNITRATERDAKGNWIPGHHFCMHYIDSIDGRTKDNWTIRMNEAVKEAVKLANPTQPSTVQPSTPAPPAQGTEPAQSSPTTSDMPSAWAAASCEKAVDSGLVAGDGKGWYGWKEPVTFERLIVLLDRLELI